MGACEVNIGAFDEVLAGWRAVVLEEEDEKKQEGNNSFPSAAEELGKRAGGEAQKHCNYSRCISLGSRTGVQSNIMDVQQKMDGGRVARSRIDKGAGPILPSLRLIPRQN